MRTSGKTTKADRAKPNKENMSNYPSVAEIQSFKDGSSIQKVRLRLVSLFEQKKGQGQHGPWAIQNAVFTDGGQNIKAMIKDRDAFPENWKGEDLIISAVSGNKGLSGLYAFDDEYQGKTERKIKITGTAKIQVVQQSQDQHQNNQPPANNGGFDSEADIAARYAAENPGLQNPPPQQRPPKKAKPPEDKLLAAKKTLIQVTNLHALCRFSVERVERPLIKSVTGRDMNENELQSATSSVFIKADRLGLSLDMPTRPFTAEDFPTK